ncbi:MAG: RNA-directed DNA polymerase [Candidatus Cloacimonetes bacterium]|nr:RNA-directed DNA polymerase [Candidatus Cloacimonadota bacterium]
MSRILKVNTKDKLRALLTDVLPYELPLWFSNFYMYTCLAETKVRGIYETVSGKKFDKWDVPLIPLTYLIYRSENKSPRAISIMHPVAQFQVCEFYSKYEDIIEYYCTRSQHSLRYPYRVASRFYGKAQKGRVGTVGVETVDEEPVVASSYFKYKQHAFLHQFFESYDYHRLEKKFPSMLQVDIAKCFPSIYTHSIGWAVKGKRLAKTRSHGSFDVDFDRLMQLTNYKETNGIIVGPEVCRIFAEVILQKIDINLVAVMNKKGWDVSKHYDFRRYVDDYFVFYSSEGVRSDFVHVLESCLLEYKMYLNEAKTVKASRPFATEISLAKSFLRREVEEYFCARFANNDAAAAGIIDIKEPGKRANQSISALKMAMARCHVEYSSVSNFLMAAIVTKSKQYYSGREFKTKFKPPLIAFPYSFHSEKFPYIPQTTVFP